MLDVRTVIWTGAIVSVALQFTIYFLLKVLDRERYDKVFNGVFLNGEKKHDRAVMRFYYYPLDWKGNRLPILFLLPINFLIAIFVLLEMFSGGNLLINHLNQTVT